MTRFLQTLNGIVWGAPALVLILGVGLFVSVKTGFAQVSLLAQAMKQFLKKLRGGNGHDGTVSSFQALCTALAATVGTGNLAGVAGAIAIGGPGSIFWMWICAILGMATKFAEVTLAVRYRDGDKGGPMYVISRGLGKAWKPLAGIYCVFGVIAAFGVGNAAQINAMTTAVGALLPNSGPETERILGFVLAAAVCLALLGGAKAIGAADVVGSIETGKQADFIVCRSDYTGKRVFLAGKELH